jgi:hypothetical protein
MVLSNVVEQFMKRNNLEFREQCAFFEWLNYYPSIRGVTFAIPNGGSRNLLEAVNLKRSGATKGVPDIFIGVPNKTAHGAFIEMKAGGNKPTKEQASMMERLRNNGYECFVVNGFAEARQAITKYLSDSFRPNL